MADTPLLRPGVNNFRRPQSLKSSVGMPETSPNEVPVYSDIYSRLTPNRIGDSTGSVFVGGNSYAGCDIKILIKLNNESDVQRGKDRVAQIESIQKSLKALEDERNRQLYQLTLGDENSQKRLSKVAGDLQISQALLDDLMKSGKDLASKAPTKVLAECQTLSIQSFRDKQAVRACGSVYPKAFTRGPREIAGSIIFTVFDEHVLNEFLRAHASDFDGVNYTTAILDQLPPVDILVSFANEYGHVSRMTIYGVEFISEGQTMSIEDLLTENVVQYVARDYDPMQAVGSRNMDKVSRQLQEQMGKKASDLIQEDDFKDYKTSDPWNRFKARRNPYL